MSRLAAASPPLAADAPGAGGPTSAALAVHLRHVARQADYWWTVYRRTWRGSAVSSFLIPVFYLAAMGVLLGRYVDASRPDLAGAPSYLHFVAPGLLASHAMQIAAGEVLWPVMGMLKWNKTYHGMISTPLRVGDVVAAHLGFVAFRVATACGVFMLALIPFGAYASWPGALLALGVQVLVGLSIAAPFYAVAVNARSDSAFAVLFRVVVTPMMLFSGAFFPVSGLVAPLRWLATTTPLYHGVELTRALLGRPLADLSWPALVGHAAYLAVFAALGSAVSVRRLRRRLIA